MRDKTFLNETQLRKVRPTGNGISSNLAPPKALINELPESMRTPRIRFSRVLPINLSLAFETVGTWARPERFSLRTRRKKIYRRHERELINAADITTDRAVCSAYFSAVVQRVLSVDTIPRRYRLDASPRNRYSWK